jgi:hypothetical protein
MRMARVCALTAAAPPIDASFDPPAGPPGTAVVVDGDPCDRVIGEDLVSFTTDANGQPPYLATTALGRAGPGLRTFMVPRLSAGRYVLVATCADCDVACVQMGGWFTVIGAPSTDVAVAGPSTRGPDPGAVVLLIAATVGGALGFSIADRRRSPRLRR